MEVVLLEDVKALGKKGQIVKAVSYTHLDVYKRQEQGFSKYSS